ncbi:MAG: hypothetical protein KDD69_18025 [Bdellovibrionales bacterium]|nr:hypothetical protein [Bdellovibrionales bacterium]
MNTLSRAILLTSFGAMLGCGGGSSGGDDVFFHGTLDDGIEAARTARAISGVEVCALGACDTTDSTGAFDFTVDEEVFLGGDVAFSFLGGGFDTMTVVQSISPLADDVFVQFQSTGTGVSTIAVFEDGNNQPTPTPTPDDDDEDIVVDDACSIIEATNVAIPNAVQMISHSLSTSPCPNGVNTIVAIANPGQVAFSYEITVDLADISVEPLTGTVQPGEINEHDGAFLCTTEESFDTQINATITMLMPEGLAPISRDEAIAQCGANASVGNLSESSPIMVVIEP